jgi:phage tail-like protein
MTGSDVRPRLLDYLPAIYHRSAQIGPFLAAFDAVLFGDDEADIEEVRSGFLPAPDGAGAAAGPGQGIYGKDHLPGSGGMRESDQQRRQLSLGQLIDRIPTLFDPDETEPEFLPWLAQWAALSLHEGIPESRYRLLIGRMIPLYAIRGTRAYVEETLALYTGAKATVDEEDLPGMRVGVRATVGLDTRLGQDPFQFRVALDLTATPGARDRLPELLDFVNVVVNLAKPAHTHFRLTHNLQDEGRGLVIFVRSTVGVDTLLWK